LTYFINEETHSLHYHQKTLGAVLVDRSPKCHPKVAVEGIEYSWGCAEGKYHCSLAFWLTKEEKKTLEILFVNVWTYRSDVIISYH
jgi:hypothetical protein